LLNGNVEPDAASSAENSSGNRARSVFASGCHVRTTRGSPSADAIAGAKSAVNDSSRDRCCSCLPRLSSAISCVAAPPTASATTSAARKIAN
jgi:hypothetical protein